MTEQDEQSLPNPVSDETGQFDPRFVLWRKFCADNDIPVGSLPGDLGPEAKKLWEKVKDELGLK
jgi:hypothetical protein